MTPQTRRWIRHGRSWPVALLRAVSARAAQLGLERPRLRPNFTSTPLASRDRASDGECLAQLGLELVVLGVGFDAQTVDRLAEEAARSGGEHDIEDLLIGEAELTQPVDVVFRHGRGVCGDLGGEIHQATSTSSNPAAR